MPIDFDPHDETVVKVHYDLAAWSTELRAEISEALAEAEIPHFWDDDELVVPEAVEGEVDALFEQLESEFGPFPVMLADEDEFVEFGLDEWSDADRAVLSEQVVHSEIPHRWIGTTLLVATDAEEAVDDLLDAIETGELGASDDEGVEPPEGVLSTIFLAAGKLAKDPADAKSRRTLIDLHEVIDAKRPPYALAPGIWSQTVATVADLVEEFHRDATGVPSEDLDTDDDVSTDEPADVEGLAAKLRDITRDYV